MIWIDAPHFFAGAVLENGKVIRSAPIISYMRGWMADKVKAYCRKKNWKHGEI